MSSVQVVWLLNSRVHLTPGVCGNKQVCSPARPTSDNYCRHQNKKTSPAVSGAAVPRTIKSLYRSILQAHRQYLPAQMRSLGDAYVKAEFRLHTRQQRQPQQQPQRQEQQDSTTATTTTAVVDITQEQLTTFRIEWEKYLSHIVSTGEQNQLQQPLQQQSQQQEMKSSQLSTVVVVEEAKSLDDTMTPIQFGEDLPQNIQLSQEQHVQLDKLRNEASKLRGEKEKEEESLQQPQSSLL